MWSEGVFGGWIDAACVLAALSLCLVVVWRVGRRVGRPRFPGAGWMLWLIAVAALPVVAHLAAGVGIWVGLLAFQGAPVGAAVGWVLVPPLACLAALSLLAALLTRRSGEEV